MIGLDDREAKLQRTARSVYCTWTPDDPSVRQLAALSGLHYHYVWRRYPDPEQARRKTLEGWIRELALSGPAVPPSGPSLHARVTALARSMAGFFGSDDYRLMLYLVVRDAARYPWLRQCYGRHMVTPMRGVIDALIADYGERLGRYAALRKGAADSFLAELESVFALRTLRPVMFGAGVAGEQVVQRCVQDLVAAVDILDLSHAA
jgi:hypothetical protein